MKLLVAVSVISCTTMVTCMDLEELPDGSHTQQQSSFLVTQWTNTVVSCIEGRKRAKLQELFARPPQVRRQHPLNQNIIEEIKTHRNDQLDAMRASYSCKKLWNKFRAITIDLGLPLATLGIGLADGIISNQRVIIALSTVYFVLSCESALKQAYSHWTMKEYQDKVEEFDVWLQVLEGMEQLKEKGELNNVHTE